MGSAVRALNAHTKSIGTGGASCNRNFYASRVWVTRRTDRGARVAFPSRMRGRAAAGVIVAAVLLGVAAPATAAVQPYGTNDAGGFRNVLPPGEQGVDNAVELGQFTAFGRRPKHWDDQQPLYEGLLYASPSLVALRHRPLLQGRDLRREARATSSGPRRRGPA